MEASLKGLVSSTFAAANCCDEERRAWGVLREFLEESASSRLRFDRPVGDDVVYFGVGESGYDPSG